MKLWLKVKPWVKWAIAVWVLVSIVILYYNFIEVIQFIFILPLESWLHSIGYVFEISDIFKWIFDLLPLGILPVYVIKIDSDSIRDALGHLVEATSLFQLLILAILLPLAIFYQNKFFANLKADK